MYIQRINKLNTNLTKGQQYEIDTQQFIHDLQNLIRENFCWRFTYSSTQNKEYLMNYNRIKNMSLNLVMRNIMAQFVCQNQKCHQFILKKRNRCWKSSKVMVTFQFYFQNKISAKWMGKNHLFYMFRAQNKKCHSCFNKCQPKFIRSACQKLLKLYSEILSNSYEIYEHSRIIELTSIQKYGKNGIKDEVFQQQELKIQKKVLQFKNGPKYQEMLDNEDEQSFEEQFYSSENSQDVKEQQDAKKDIQSGQDQQEIRQKDDNQGNQFAEKFSRRGLQKMCLSGIPNDYIYVNTRNMQLYAGHEDKAWYYQKVYGCMNGQDDEYFEQDQDF